MSHGWASQEHACFLLPRSPSPAPAPAGAPLVSSPWGLPQTSGILRRAKKPTGRAEKLRRPRNQKNIQIFKKTKPESSILMKEVEKGEAERVFTGLFLTPRQPRDRPGARKRQVEQGLAFVGVPQAAWSANRPRNPDPGAAQNPRAVFMVYTRFGR